MADINYTRLPDLKSDDRQNLDFFNGVNHFHGSRFTVIPTVIDPQQGNGLHPDYDTSMDEEDFSGNSHIDIGSSDDLHNGGGADRNFEDGPYNQLTPYPGYLAHIDYYKDGRLRSLSRISEASHASGEYESKDDHLHPNPPPPSQINDYSNPRPTAARFDNSTDRVSNSYTAPVTTKDVDLDPNDWFVPEAFINSTFNIARDDASPCITFPAIPPPPSKPLAQNGIGDASTNSSTKTVSGNIVNSSSCDNLDIKPNVTSGVTSGAIELLALTVRSESTPELTELSRPVSLVDNSGAPPINVTNDPRSEGIGNVWSSPHLLAEIPDQTKFAVPIKNDTKRSNLKKKTVHAAPSSLNNSFVHRPGSPEGGGKKSISFSSIIYFKGNENTESESLIAPTEVPRSYSESGTRPHPRDYYKLLTSAQEGATSQDKASKPPTADPTGDVTGDSAYTNDNNGGGVNTDIGGQGQPLRYLPQKGFEGSVFSRALKNFRSKAPRPSDEGDIPFIDDIADNLRSGRTSNPDTMNFTMADLNLQNFTKGDDSVFSPTDNEDTMTSFAGSEWSAQIRSKKKVASLGGVSGTIDDSESDDVFTTKRGASVEKSAGMSEELKNSLVIVLSGLYGVILVVLGLVLPISETYAKPQNPYFFETFYLYLYGVSMMFLVYVYTYLLRRERLSLLSLPRTFSRLSGRFSRTSSQRSSRRNSFDKGSGSQARGTNPKPLLSARSSIKSYSIASSYSNRSRRRKIGYNSETSNHTGSFYLRVGVIGFGIGSMLHSGLIFGHYFEINHIGHPCSDILQAIKPVAHLCFTFIQMYFVFMNSKMCVHKYKTLARFGLIHMSSTNICVWLRSIVVETLHVIEMEERKKRQMTVISQVMNSTVTMVQNTTVRSPLLTTFHDEDGVGSLPELDCHFDAMMGKIVEKSSVYLYPCTIEYSLVCACVLYVMWTNVGEAVSGKRLQSIETASDDGLSRESMEDEEEKTNIMSVDCAGSSRGLFLGIFLFVICVICLICYYVLASSEEHRTAAIVLSHISEDVIYVLALAATSVAAFHMRQMHFSFAREARIEEILMLISLSGLLIYGMFSIVASLFYLDTLEGGLTILTNLLMMIQSSTQATFTLAALRASASHRSQIEDKPGKQYVTFLLIANFALWAINTFETQKMEHNVVQVQFYGSTAWAIFSHISVPLGIYFRFHSTVSLSNVWKKAWKHKHAQHHGLHTGAH